MSKRRSDLKKKLKISKIKTYFIFWEGETEKCYFSAFRDFLWTDNGIIFEIASRPYKQIWTTNSKLVEARKSILNKIYDSYNWFTEKELINLGSKVFILLDTDWINWYTKEQIITINKFFKEDKLIKVLFSNRDFELFILLHLKYYSWTSSDYIPLIHEFEKDFWKGYNIKLKQIHRRIIEKWFLEELPENILKLKKLHKDIWNSHIKDMIPFTEVYEILKKAEE